MSMSRKLLGFGAAVVALCGVAKAAMLQPGDTFPGWKLKDHTGAEVSSSDLAGKMYLLWFYPKAMTSGCTKEGQGLRDHYGELKDLKVTVLGISFDDPAANAEFVKRENFPFKLLSDSDHALAGQVGAVYVKLQPIASRVSFLIGPDGKILKTYDSVDPSTHAEEVVRDARALSGK